VTGTNSQRNNSASSQNFDEDNNPAKLAFCIEAMAVNKVVKNPSLEGHMNLQKGTRLSIVVLKDVLEPVAQPLPLY
jgi:hypothetical protein